MVSAAEKYASEIEIFTFGRGFRTGRLSSAISDLFSQLAEETTNISESETACAATLSSGDMKFGRMAK